MSRRCFLIPLVLLAALCQPLWAQEYVRIGSWNIEHLGSRQYGQHPLALAQHILLAGVDVLALQEIYDTDGDASARTNERLDEVVEVINRHDGQDWTYILFPKRDPHETHQLVGVAWNRERVQLRDEMKIPVEYGSPETWKRHPYAVKFQVADGKTDFVMIPVHMKSNFNGEDIGRQTRAAEAAALVATLDQVRQTMDDDDVIIIGDTNCVEAAEDALGLYDDAGFRDLNDDDAITYRKGQYASPFDRILIPRGQAEFRFSYQYVLSPTDPNRHRRRLSDHFVVVAAITVMDDDDGSGSDGQS